MFAILRNSLCLRKKVPMEIFTSKLQIHILRSTASMDIDYEAKFLTFKEWEEKTHHSFQVNKSHTITTVINSCYTYNNKNLADSFLEFMEEKDDYWIPITKACYLKVLTLDSSNYHLYVDLYNEFKFYHDQYPVAWMAAKGTLRFAPFYKYMNIKETMPAHYFHSLGLLPKLLDPNEPLLPMVNDIMTWNGIMAQFEKEMDDEKCRSYFKIALLLLCKSRKNLKRKHFNDIVEFLKVHSIPCSSGPIPHDTPCPTCGTELLSPKENIANQPKRPSYSLYERRPQYNAENNRFHIPLHSNFLFPKEQHCWMCFTF